VGNSSILSEVLCIKEKLVTQSWIHSGIKRQIHKVMPILEQNEITFSQNVHKNSLIYLRQEA
jgi:hypothetical protein